MIEMQAEYAPAQPARSVVAAAYAACALGVLHAAISAYWGLGGKALLATVGGVFQQEGKKGSLDLVAAVWIVVLLKLLAAALAPLAVNPRPPLALRRRREVRLAAWAAAVILTVYGGLLSVVGWLVQVGVVSAGAHADHRALRWHAFLWDPWFLVWGLLLAFALARTRRSP